MDGKTLIRDYTGFTEYRDDLGVIFAVGTVDGSMASTVFGGLRFEIPGITAAASGHRPSVDGTRFSEPACKSFVFSDRNRKSEHHVPKASGWGYSRRNLVTSASSPSRRTSAFK